jgi:hypothetical protein
VSNQQAGRAGKIKQWLLKTKGVKTGWPDIQLFWYDTGLHCLMMEVKWGKYGTTVTQQRVHEDLLGLKIPTYIVRSLDDVKSVLERESVPHREARFGIS